MRQDRPFLGLLALRRSDDAEWERRRGRVFAPAGLCVGAIETRQGSLSPKNLGRCLALVSAGEYIGPLTSDAAVMRRYDAPGAFTGRAAVEFGVHT